jgi:hypothetical protein
MLSEINQKAIILIVALFFGKSLRTNEDALYLIGGIALFWVLYHQSSILSFLKRLYSPAPPNAVSKSSRIPMVHLYDPEIGQMSAIPRALIIELFEKRRDTPHP